MHYLKELSSIPISKEPAFSDEEYQGRVAKVRAEMDEAGLDVLLVTSPPNLCYLGGYYTFAVGMASCLVLPRTGDLAIQVPSVDVPAAVVTGWVKNVLSYEWYETDSIATQLASLIKELGSEKKNIGVELRRSSFSVHLYEQLKALLPRAQFLDASGTVFKVRMVKSETELIYMRRAAQFTVAGIKASLLAIAPGKTDNEVAAIGYETMVRAGSEFMCHQPIVTTGRRSGLAHTTFKRTSLSAGDVVFMEYGGCYQRYTAPLMRTAVIGEPSLDVRRVADASSATVAAVLENVKAGRTADDVARAARKGHAPVDSEVFFQGVYGYCVGVGFPPAWNEGLTYIAQGNKQVLQSGMTFHVAIALRSPGRFGVGLSETIVVTETGCEILTETERGLLILDS